MSRQFTKTHIVELEIGDEFWPYTIQLEWAITRDEYGSDADGNRGVTKDIPRVLEVVEVIDKDGKEVTDKDLIDKIIEKCEPPDYDDYDKHDD